MAAQDNKSRMGHTAVLLGVNSSQLRIAPALFGAGKWELIARISKTRPGQVILGAWVLFAAGRPPPLISISPIFVVSELAFRP